MSEADLIAEEYARGELTRRDAVALLSQEGVNGIAAGKLLADAMAAAGGGSGAAAGPPSATA